MALVDKKLGRLHWPPLVKEITQTKEYPGYRYEFFQSFRELDEYFIKECGEGWREQEWAKYWIRQHARSSRKDSREVKRKTPWKSNTGPRSDREELWKAAQEIISEDRKISSYKLARSLKDNYDLSVSQKTAWHMIKKYKEQHDSLS